MCQWVIDSFKGILTYSKIFDFFNDPGCGNWLGDKNTMSRSANSLLPLVLKIQDPTFYHFLIGLGIEGEPYCKLHVNMSMFIYQYLNFHMHDFDRIFF